MCRCRGSAEVVRFSRGGAESRAEVQRCRCRGAAGTGAYRCRCRYRCRAGAEQQVKRY